MRFKGTGRISVGHPVDVATGTLFHDFEDYVLPGQVPLVFGRHYSSALAGQGKGMFGAGWSSPFEMWLRRDLDGFTLVDEDGESEITFDDPDGLVDQGSVVRNLGVFHEIASTSDEYIVTRWDPDSDDIKRYVFVRSASDASLSLSAILDGASQGINIIRDTHGRALRIVQRREQRGYLVSYSDEGRVTEVRVLAPNNQDDKESGNGKKAGRLVLRYSYNGDGRLTSMTDALGQTCHYEYDADGYLVREVNIAGMVYEFKYNRQRRCIETTGANGYGLSALEFDPKGGVTRVSNAVGEVTTYEWNDSGQVECEISPLGHAKSTVYDELGRIVSRIDANGATTAYVYDERGDRVKVTSPTGAETLYAFDGLHRVVAITDPEGHVWQRRYDNAGRVTAVINPLENAIGYEYNGAGDLVAILDPAGNRTQFRWDGLGNLTRIIDPLGNQTQYEYSAEGQLTAVVDAKGFRTEAKLDALGRVTEVILPDGARRCFSWNAYDQITEYVDELGATTRWHYEHCGVPAEVIRPHGGRIRFDWSPVPGRLLAVTNEHGERYRFEYDVAGNLIRETDFGDRETAYAVDAAGQVAQVIDAAGRRTDLSRNEDETVTKIVYEEGVSAVFEYSPRGLLVKADNGQCPVERQYDAVGRLVYEKQGEHEVFSQYDALGNRIRRRSSLGYETEFAWNANYQLTRLMHKGFAPLEFQYDERQDEVARFVEGGVRITQAYDARGRRIEQQVTAEGVWRAGRVAVGEGAVVHRKYSYDAASNLTRLIDKNWGATEYTYDTIGRILSADLPGKLSERFEYDLADNIVSIQRSQTPKKQRLARETAEACRYEKGNTLVQKDDARYEYDALGQLVTKTNGKGATEFRWNQAGQLIGARLPDGDEWRYEYDAFGRRTRKVGPGETIEFVWDGDVVLHELREVSKGAAKADAEVVQWEFEPDSFAPLGKIEKRAQYFCVNDVAGNPRELVSQASDVVWAKQFAAWGEESDSLTAKVECPVRFQGQWYDSETGQHYHHFRYYDPRTARYISVDPTFLRGGHTNFYIYAPNAFGWVDPFGLSGIPLGLSPRSWRTQGREFRIDWLAVNAFDPSLPKHVRGWLRQERNRIARGRAIDPRTPPGYVMAHGRTTPAREGYDYSNARLSGEDLNKLEERIRRKHEAAKRKKQQKTCPQQ